MLVLVGSSSLSLVGVGDGVRVINVWVAVGVRVAVPSNPTRNRVHVAVGMRVLVPVGSGGVFGSGSGKRSG